MQLIALTKLKLQDANLITKECGIKVIKLE